jgi:hypothetical protein
LSLCDILGLLEKNIFLVDFCHFGGHRPMSPIILVKILSKNRPMPYFLDKESEKNGPEIFKTKNLVSTGKTKSILKK